MTRIDVIRTSLVKKKILVYVTNAADIQKYSLTNLAEEVNNLRITSWVTKSFLWLWCIWSSISRIYLYPNNYHYSRQSSCYVNHHHINNHQHQKKPWGSPRRRCSQASGQSTEQSGQSVDSLTMITIITKNNQTMTIMIITHDKNIQWCSRWRLCSEKRSPPAGDLQSVSGLAGQPADTKLLFVFCTFICIWRVLLLVLVLIIMI